MAAKAPDIELLQKAATAFSPSAPIDQRSLFAGRIQQLTEVINAVSQKGQHVVLFGERGVGKTSLATVISNIYRNRAVVPSSGPVNCDPTMNFAALWRAIFSEIPLSYEMNSLGFVQQTSIVQASLADALGHEPATPDSVRRTLSKAGKTIIVIDELDRLQDTSATALLADTIKNLSDHAVDTTLILVGVADSIDTLISEHQSVERALVQIRMPRMSKTELFEIISKGVSTLGLTIQESAKNKIASLSQGLPHYAHLLGLHASQMAIGNGRANITMEDVRAAIDRAMDKAQQSIISAHHRATSSPRENLYPQVLLACAMAKTDNLGSFAAIDVRGLLSIIMKRQYEIPAFSQHLNAFCEAERGPVLQRSGTPRRYRFRFVNPLMQPYVIMDGMKRKLIDEADAIA